MCIFPSDLPASSFFSVLFDIFTRMPNGHFRCVPTRTLGFLSRPCSTCPDPVSSSSQSTDTICPGAQALNPGTNLDPSLSLTPALVTPSSESWLCILLSPQMNSLPLEHTGGSRSPVATLPCLYQALNSGGRSLIFLRRQRCPVTSSLKTFQRPSYALLTGSLCCTPETYKTL